MSELRWDPVLREWVITATHRQDRTFKPPAHFCPLCPTRPGGLPTEIPREQFEFAVFENKFPSFRPDAPVPSVAPTPWSPVQPSSGVCEVVVYSPSHDLAMSSLRIRQIERLIRVWTDRYIELGALNFVNYVLIFENRGEEVGVTLHHPHGQIYAMPFIPPKAAREIESASLHRDNTGHCLFCDILESERSDGRRIIAENESFTAFIPFYAHYPYEVHVYSRMHTECLPDFTAGMRRDLAAMLKLVTLKYDHLFDRPMPYMLIMHQRPTDGQEYPVHFHIEFYPILRSAGRLKYLAGCESGGGTFINDTHPEEKAAEFRAVPPTAVDELEQEEED